MKCIIKLKLCINFLNTHPVFDFIVLCKPHFVFLCYITCLHLCNYIVNHVVLLSFVDYQNSKHMCICSLVLYFLPCLICNCTCKVVVSICKHIHGLVFMFGQSWKCNTVGIKMSYWAPGMHIKNSTVRAEIFYGIGWYVATIVCPRPDCICIMYYVMLMQTWRRVDIIYACMLFVICLACFL